MTKVRVCVGVHGGLAFAYGDSLMDDKGLEKTMLNEYSISYRPEVSVSFHDLEVESPQAPVKFEFGDLVRADSFSQGNIKQWAVAHTNSPGNCKISIVVPHKFSELSGPTDFDHMCVQFDSEYGFGVCNGHPEDCIHLIAKAGNWHIANGEVVLAPPPQPEPEVKTKFQFGDLVRWHTEEQYAVAHPTLRNAYKSGVTVVQCQYFYKIVEPTHYTKLTHLLGYGGGPTGGVCNGYDGEYFTLVAPAGQWHINSSGEVVLKPKSEVPKPKFKRGDKVTRMQLGKLETWQVVDPVPNEDGMIILLGDGWMLEGCTDWRSLAKTFGNHCCGVHYRMSYEDDCTLVPEITAPQGLKPGDMVVDQNNELWDVDEISDKYVGFVWLSSKNLVGRRLGSTHDLKKVVFGTL